MRTELGWLAAAGLGALLVLFVPGGHAQHQHPPGPGQAPARDTHEAHGTPPGWKFTLPKGNAAKGREVFAKLECWTCHEVKGEKFPAPPKDQGSIGPELSEMAQNHEAEFFAEAIVNPNAVIDEKKWAGPDGASKMPSFNDSMTVQEMIDLVAYLRSLTPPPGAGHKH